MVKNREKNAVDQSSRPGQLRSNKKKKTNSAPADLDMQEIPFKLREIMKSRAEMNKPKQKKQKKKKTVIGRYLPLNDEIRTSIPIPKFKKNKRESVGAYLDRMDREVKHVMFLSKNQADREPEQEVTEDGPVKVPESSETQEKPQRKDPYYRRKADKAIKKKEEQEASRLEKDLYRDHVEFGEVAMEPPQITAKPRKSTANVKPGQKSLLLKQMFVKGGESSKTPAMSMARKRLIEEERERVVEAYREMKKRKQQQSAKTDF